jgi:hypothetical protein
MVLKHYIREQGQMKKLLLIMTVLGSISAFAADPVLDCAVSRMFNEDILEESFSKDEYPEVFVEKKSGKLVVHIGANTFENDSEYKIQELKPAKSGSFAFLVKRLADSATFVISASEQIYAGQSTMFGSVIYVKKKKVEVLAEIICK